MILSAIGSGIILGAVIFLVFNGAGTGGRPAGAGRETETTGGRTVAQAASEPETDGKTNSKTNPEKNPETSPEIQIETDKESETAQETEDFSAYFGTYAAKDGHNLIIELGENKNETDTPHQIGPQSLLYVDDVERSQEGLVGYGSYFGLAFSVSLDKLDKLTDRDASVHVGDGCTIIENWTQVLLYQESRQDSGAYNVSLYPGETLQVMEVKNGYLKTRTPEGVYGWVQGNCVTKLSTDFPYRMVCDESSGQQSISFYLEIPGSANIILEEADGTIGEGSILRFGSFSEGWGYTVLEGAGVWINMLNAQPVSQTAQVSVLDYQVNSRKPEGRTDFYADGRVVGADEFIIPEAQSRLLTESDLSALTLKGISYAKNELYAKYGRKFKSRELTEYMSTKTWYIGIYEPEEYDSQIVQNRMNEYERKNVELLAAREQALGAYQYDED